MIRSKSDILREIIYKALDNEVDLSTASQRNEFLQNYLKSHPNFICHRTLFVKICKQCHKARNIDLHRLKLSRKKKFDVKLAEKLRQEQYEHESVMYEQTLDDSLQLQPDDLIHDLYNDCPSVKFTKALLRGFLAPFETKYPQNQLSEDTYEQLSNMWHPSIERCDIQTLKYIILPALSTLTLLGTKVYGGYSIKKRKSLSAK